MPRVDPLGRENQSGKENGAQYLNLYCAFPRTPARQKPKIWQNGKSRGFVNPFPANNASESADSRLGLNRVRIVFVLPYFPFRESLVLRTRARERNGESADSCLGHGERLVRIGILFVKSSNFVQD